MRKSPLPLGFKEDHPQETLSLIGIIESSETTRQSFSSIYSRICKYSSLSVNKNKTFSYYLAGLIEGDGTIIIPLYHRDKKVEKLIQVFK